MLPVPESVPLSINSASTKLVQCDLKKGQICIVDPIILSKAIYAPPDISRIAFFSTVKEVPSKNTYEELEIFKVPPVATIISI